MSTLFHLPFTLQFLVKLILLSTFFSLVESNEALDAAWDGKATSECYKFAYPLALVVKEPTWSCDATNFP